ncbi:Rqc2 family fibronectin-binding protein [Scopulibacillus cellulosilyticus]|uniref:Rqc2 homolog RqcH n=1 Tax=Scopulibacillus cellulosilyticus TaxID=2665665 RepID=A0ABW2PW15_9BACL
MAYDGIVTRAVTESLQQMMTGSRVTKIYQPHKTDLLFHIRSQRKNYKLLFSANAQFARCHLITAAMENPKEPSMFCMLLRKHLEGSIIDQISQDGFERIIHIDFRSRDELGDTVYKRLIIELMGKHSNIILTEKDSGRIIDSIKHLSPSVNRYRTVLPGQAYVSPPPQNKYDPLKVSENDLLKVLDLNAGKIDRQLVQNISGFSPQLAKEIIHRAGLPTIDAILKSFFAVQNQIKQGDYKPNIVYEKQGKDQFHVIDMTHQSGQHKFYDDVHRMLEDYYLIKSESDQVKQRAGDLSHFMINEQKKNQTKLKKLYRTLKESEEAKTFQLYGELVTAHMHMIKQGDKELEAVNYYDENQSKIIIPLNPNKTPSENAQSYFKKYNKAKNAKYMVEKQIEKTKEEIDYFDRLLQQIESASLKDIDEIREELEDGGYLKRKNRGKQKNKKQKPQLEKYTATDGTLILVGKNNKQNDFLTTKEANSNETWLHTKDIPGSHVVIRSQDFSDETLMEAANLAAYFSKSKLSSSVPVDYTLIKHVKKPSGAKPGFVIYDHQKTVYVTPDEQLVIKMRKEPSAHQS